MDLSRIHAYRAVNDRLSTSGQPTASQLAAIAEAGFQTIVNLALHDDPRYSLADEPGVVRGLGLKYVHIPVQFAAPQAADLQAFCDAMDAASGQKVWVHCAANKRVSVFLGLYRVVKQGWPQTEAFALMHELWEPDSIWQAFIGSTLADAPT